MTKAEKAALELAEANEAAAKAEAAKAALIADLEKAGDASFPDNLTPEEKGEKPEQKLGAIKDGFFFALVGASVRDEKDNIISREYSAKDTKLKATNVEAPCPLTDEAAIKMAENCETLVYKFDEKQNIVEVKLTGIRAAVQIAITQYRENIRNRLRAGKIQNEKELRGLFAESYGFAISEVPTAKEEDVKGNLVQLLAKCAEEGRQPTPEEMMAAISAAGVKMSVRKTA